MQYVVSTRNSNLNVRSGPGMHYPVVRSLPRSSRVEVLETRGHWRRLAQGGWAHADYLTAASGQANVAVSIGEAVIEPQVARTIRLSVPMVQQQFSPTCLLASAAMVMQFKGRYTPSTADLGLHGNPDFRFRGLTVGNAFPTQQQQQLVLKRLGFSGIRSQQCSEESIFRILDEHGPFLLLHHVGMFWYGATVPIPPQARGSGHAVVVTGVDVSRHMVFFHNPWGQRDVPTTASSICNAIARFERDAASYAIWYLKSPR